LTKGEYYDALLEDGTVFVLKDNNFTVGRRFLNKGSNPNDYGYILTFKLSNMNYNTIVVGDLTVKN
jgi:hypothetical protein